MLGTIKSKFASVTADKRGSADAPQEEDWWPRVQVAVAAVDESSKLTRSLFTYFLTACLYVAITVFGTTQETLLLNAGVVLPIISVNVPVNAFYILAPLILVAFHLNLIVKLWVLRKKALYQIDSLAEEFDGQDGKAVTAFRELLFPYDFTLLTAGPKNRPITKAAVSLVMAFTVFLGPMALLIVTMQRFAPAGLDALTLFHGWLIFFDAAVLAFLRFGMQPRASVLLRAPAIAQAVMLVIVGALSLWLADFRVGLRGNEPALDANPPRVNFFGATPEELADYEKKRAELSFAEAFEMRANLRFNSDRSGLSDQEVLAARLLLPVVSGPPKCLINPAIAPEICKDLRSGDIVNDSEARMDAAWDRIWMEVSSNTDQPNDQRKRLSEVASQLCSAQETGHQLDLSGRNLRRAQLESMVAPCTNLSGADLSGAQLYSANLDQSALFRAVLRGTDLDGTSLYGARLFSADLAGATADFANFTEAVLSSTTLTSGSFDYSLFTDTSLRGSDMSGSSFNGSDFSSANLRDANLTRAKLDEVNGGYADFRGSLLVLPALDYAILVSADFRDRRRLTRDPSTGDFLTIQDHGPVLFGVSVKETVASGIRLPSVSVHNNLLIVDDACFGPIMAYKDTFTREDINWSAECGDSLSVEPGQLARLYRPSSSVRFDSLPIDIDAVQPGDQIYPAPGDDLTLPDDFAEIACVLRERKKPIGPNGEIMEEIRPCWDNSPLPNGRPTFYERMRWKFCGEYNHDGKIPEWAADNENFNAESMMIGCDDVGLGKTAEEERAWLMEKFPDFNWDDFDQ